MMVEKNSLRAIVIGGSLGGLYAALWLRHVGYDVEVFERSRRPLFGRGAGIVSHPASVEILQVLSEAEAEDSSTTRVSFDFELDAVSRCGTHFVFSGRDKSEDVTHKQSLRVTSYNSLLNALVARMDCGRYHLGHNVVRIEQQQQEQEGQKKVHVWTEDGTRYSSDILVCADGSMSEARDRLVGVPSETKGCGYIAWRGIVRQDMLPENARKRFEGGGVYHLMEDSHMLCYMIPYVEDGEDNDDKTVSIYLNWLWYRPISDARLHAMMTGNDGVERQRTVLPGFVQQAFVDELRLDARERLPAEFVTVVETTKALFLQKIVDTSIERMKVGNTFFVGDAAFTMRPHVAVATAKAADDARTLAMALKRDGFDADGEETRKWELEQMKLGRDCVERSRKLGDSLQSGQYDKRKRIEFGLRKPGDSHY